MLKKGTVGCYIVENAKTKYSWNLAGVLYSWKSRNKVSLGV